MLGILSAESEFAGGAFSLKKDGVQEAFQKIGDQMGYSAEEAAFDSWRVVNANMSQAVRRTTAGKGIDPKEMVMLAYGGNGPAFAAIQAEDLGITRVLVPKASPTFSALGTLVAKPSIDEERSYISPANAPDTQTLKALWKELDDRATKYFADANYGRDKITAKFQMKMRYPGQNFALTFDIKTVKGRQDLSFIDDDLGTKAIELFNKRHTEEYGHVREGEMPEIIGVRLETSVDTPVPPVVKGFKKPVPAKPAKTRRANLGQGYGTTNIYVGTDLKPGHEVMGPAVIEESFTTIVVYPGWKALVDNAGDYELTWVAAQK
jgi:N-methylhydantoinase A